MFVAFSRLVSVSGPQVAFSTVLGIFAPSYGRPLSKSGSPIRYFEDGPPDVCFCSGQVMRKAFGKLIKGCNCNSVGRDFEYNRNHSERTRFFDTHLGQNKKRCAVMHNDPNKSKYVR